MEYYTQPLTLELTFEQYDTLARALRNRAADLDRQPRMTEEAARVWELSRMVMDAWS